MINENLYERDIRLLEREVLPKYESPVVFYGSSSIRLWKTLSEDFPEYDVINLGFGGSTLDLCIYYFDRLIKPLRIKSFVFYAGDNDIGEGREADEVIETFKIFYQKFREHFPDVRFTYLSIKPSESRMHRLECIVDVNRSIKEFLSQERNCYFLNVFDEMLDENMKVRKDLYTLDKLHMNSNGYRLWKKIIECHSDKIF